LHEFLKVMEEQKNKEELAVSNRNTNMIINYCKKRGVEPSALLGHLGYPEAYLTNPDQWVSLPIFCEITKRARKAFGDDPTIFYETGLQATTEGGLGALESMKRLIGVFFADAKFLIAKIPTYNNYFNKTKTMELVDVTATEAIIKIQFHKPIDPVYDFNSGPLVKGVLASIPRVWNLPPANVQELLLEYDLVRLLKQHFSMYAEIRDNLLYIEGTVYGRVMELVKQYTHSGYVYMGKYKEVEDTGAPTGILITKSLEYKTYPLLIPGQIYNAPYFILKVTWEHASYWKRIRSYFSGQLMNADSYLNELEGKADRLQSYARELEDTIRERNKIIMDEKQEVERLKNELNNILSSHLPPDLVHAMTTHKLVPKRNHGVVLFADLVGFSKRVHATEDFAPMLRDLNRFFGLADQVIKARDGWVYKYLGDAVMAVYGGYKANENYPHLAAKAVESAQKIVTMTNEMGWDIRVGIEYGDFIAGEIGHADNRIWDFLGETVNYACRLGQHAEKNEILLGPRLMELLQKKVQTKDRTLLLKGIGEQTVHSLVGNA